MTILLIWVITLTYHYVVNPFDLNRVRNLNLEVPVNLTLIHRMHQGMRKTEHTQEEEHKSIPLGGLY